MELNRRNVLKGAAGATAAGIGVAALTGGATAQSNAEFTANKIEDATADGIVTSLTVSVTGSFSFEGLDSAATNATVALAARDSSAESPEWETLTTTTVTPPAAQQADGVGFGTLEGDLLSLGQFTGDQFSADGDGTTNESDVELQLTVTVDYGTSSSVTDNTATNLAVVMNNTPAGATGSGEAGGELGTSYHIGTSPTNPDADVETEGVLDVRVIYGTDYYTYLVDLAEPWSDPAEDHANLGLGFDVDQSGSWDFQVNWSSADGFFSANDSRDDYDSYETVVGEPVDGTKDGTQFQFRIPADAIGDPYLFVANASYGGATHANVSTDPAHSWSSADSWTSSEYFLEVPVQE